MALVKLDLAGGLYPYGRGALNVDAQRLPTVAVQADLRYLPFKVSSADMVIASQCIEHFGREDAAAVLVEIARVLKPGGTLRIAFPDMVKLARNLRRLPFWIIERHTFGEQTNEYQYHKSGWSKAYMAAVLKALGFWRIRETAESVGHMYAELTTELEAIRCG